MKFPKLTTRLTKIIFRGKKPFFPLGFKLISIISAIIVISLSAMIILATFFFKDDSEKRIEENNLKIAELTAAKVKGDFLAIVDKANIIAATLQGGDAGKSARKKKTDDEDRGEKTGLFLKDRDFIYTGIAVRDDGGMRLTRGAVNEHFTAESGMERAAIEKAALAEAANFAKSFNAETVVVNASPYFKQPVLGISVPYVKKGEDDTTILVILVKTNRFLEAVKSPGIVKSFIVNRGGDLIAHYNSALVVASTSFLKLPIVNKMVKSASENLEQNRYRDDRGERFMGSFKKTGFAGTGVITTVPEDAAFHTVYRIRRWNIIFAIIIINLAVLIVYYFAKTVSGPVTRLVAATREIEKGNFMVDITPTTRDEVGMLTESFAAMGKGLSEREKMKEAFGKFVNKEIAEMVLRDEIKLGGERKVAAIFFSDIREFTSISEKLEPEEVVEFLNQYMTRMVKCVNDTGGVVDKFIGDAIMAVWGTPVSKGNDTEHAVNGALMMRASLAEFNRGRSGDRKPVIKIGCGINTGPVLAGQIGSSDRMEYTVIGDTVNLASRIESLNKPFGTDILISADAYALVKDIFAVEPMKQIMVKGKSVPQQIYAVIGRLDDPARPESLVELRKLLNTSAVDLDTVDPDEHEVKYEIIE